MATQPAPKSAAPTSHRLTGSLGVRSIVFMVIAAAAPLAVMGSVPISIMFGNGAGVPANFVVSGVILLFFAVGFVAMTPHVRESGAFYSYVSSGLGRPVGVGAAMLALVAYAGMQVAIYGYVGQVVNDLLTRYGITTLPPWWAWSAVLLVAVGFLGFRNIELSGKVLGVLLIVEVGIVLVLDLAVTVKGGPEGLSTGFAKPSTVLSGAPAIGLMLATSCFLGFESTAIFRSEARDPERTIPRATYVALGVIGLFYAVSSWALITAWGDSTVVERAAKDPTTMLVDTAQNYLGVVMGDVFNVLLLTSLFASALSFHNVTARYYFNLGNTGVLHSGLGRSHSRHRSPAIASLMGSAIIGVAIVVCAVAGLDPMIEVFTWLSSLATVGVMVLMALTSAAVIVFFRRNKHLGGSPLQTLVAPAGGVIGLTAVLCLLVSNLTFLMGGSVAVAITAMGALVVAFVAGVVLSRRPEVVAAERQNADDQ